MSANFRFFGRQKYTFAGHWAKEKLIPAELGADMLVIL